MPTEENRSDSPYNVDGDVSGVARMLTVMGRCSDMASLFLAAGVVILTPF